MFFSCNLEPFAHCSNALEVLDQFPVRRCFKFEAAFNDRRSQLVQRMRRVGRLKNPIAFLCVVVSACCLFVVFLSILRLPEAPAGIRSFDPHSAAKLRKLSRSLDAPNLGLFGEMMVGMLPSDLVFTVFVPSAKAFERDLRLSATDSFSEGNINNTYPTISRVLGFSAVPRHLSSAALPVGREVNYDSVSGFVLHVSRGAEGVIVVNGVRSERVDVKKGEIVVHVIDGVVMDADFEQSVQADDD